jgi:hypothetical protein
MGMSEDLQKEANGTGRHISLEEIRQLYERLGIEQQTSSEIASFEEYAWRYGFKPRRPREETSLDARTVKKDA